MKLTTIILLTTCMMVSASIYSQETRLTLQSNDISYEDLFRQIEIQTGYRFAFSSSKFDPEQTVNIDADNASLEEVLNKALPENISYEIMDHYVVITDVAGSETENNTQQRKNISGTVTDESGSPLPGATIVIKGTTRGTISNIDGKFVMFNLPGDAVLEFSFIGMKSQEIAIGNQQDLKVVMKTDVLGIEEVIAIGYGSAKKSDLTGAVQSVKVSELNDLPNVSVLESLHGTVPGLEVSPVTEVGTDPEILLRGNNTFSSGSVAPLIVLDGSIYRGNLIDINPNDIESVEILKDASSVAIYGSQASNGVLLISTKKGADYGKPIISYSGSYSYNVPSYNLTPMKSKEYESFFKDVTWRDSRLGPDYLQPNPDYDLSLFLDKYSGDGYLNGVDHDWWGDFTRNGFINDHNLSLRGKNKNLSYYMSGGYTSAEGYVVNNDYTRYSIKANMEAEINSWMKVGMESFCTSTVGASGGSPILQEAFYAQPWLSPTLEDGTLNFSLNQVKRTYSLLETRKSDKRLNLFSNVHADIKLPLKGLSYRFAFSQNYRTSNYDYYDPNASDRQGTASKKSDIGYNWSADNILTYENTFNDIHKINATLVYGVEKWTGSNTSATASEFVDDLFGYNALQTGNNTLNKVGSGAWQETSLYSLARVMYNLKDKYLLTASIRRDGFSGFGENNKLGYFPSMALGWVISEESFLKDKIKWLNYLKLRTSYGSSGRRALQRYSTYSQITSTWWNYVWGEGATEAAKGLVVSTMSNKDLEWETTTGVNIGMDYGLLDSRISGNIEYYNTNTRGILFDINLPGVTGFNTVQANIGQVHNYGIESSVSFIPVKTKDFQWNGTINFTRERNEIVSILGKDNDADGDGREDDLVANEMFIGEPRHVIYDYEVTGMWQLNDEIPDGFYPGTYKIADLSGPDGTPDGNYSASYDKKILGYPEPSYRFSIANQFKYKNFSLYMLINSVQGGKNRYMGYDGPGGYWGKYEQLLYMNVPTGAWDYWMPENPDARYPQLGQNATYPGYLYSQRNFVRLQDLSLKYKFKKEIIQKLDMRSLEIYFSAKNLLTLTKWRGWDPETGGGFAPGRPLMRNYTVGVNVEF